MHQGPHASEKQKLSAHPPVNLIYHLFMRIIGCRWGGYTVQHRLLLTQTPTDQQADRTAKQQPEKSKQHLELVRLLLDMTKTDD